VETYYIINDGSNRVQSYDGFYRLHEDINAQKTNYRIMLKNGQDAAANAVLLGVDNLISEYNAKASSTKSGDWRPRDLPNHIDPFSGE
jgi:hypothetical protein